MFQTTLDPDTHETLTLILFKNVTNTPEIREAVIRGQLKCCVIKPSLILDPFQVVVATNKAVLSHMRNKMNTRTVFSEILFNLSITKNISQSLVKFGIEDSEKNMLVCLLTKEIEGSVDDVISRIKGEQCPIEELFNFSDTNLIKETYKEFFFPWLELVPTRWYNSTHFKSTDGCCEGTLPRVPHYGKFGVASAVCSPD